VPLTDSSPGHRGAHKSRNVINIYEFTLCICAHWCSKCAHTQILLFTLKSQCHKHNVMHWGFCAQPRAEMRSCVRRKIVLCRNAAKWEIGAKLHKIWFLQNRTGQVQNLEPVGAQFLSMLHWSHIRASQILRNVTPDHAPRCKHIPVKVSKLAPAYKVASCRKDQGWACCCSLFDLNHHLHQPSDMQ